MEVCPAYKAITDWDNTRNENGNERSTAPKEDNDENIQKKATMEVDC